MTLYYSKSTKGFYDNVIHKTIPTDAVEITEDQREALLKSESNGQVIQADDNGNPQVVNRPALSNEELIALYEKAAQSNLDTVARSWGYDSLVSAASYVNSTNPQFKTEAEALINWRDNYWTEAYTIEAGVLPATAEAFVALLPAAPIKPTV